MNTMRQSSITTEQGRGPVLETDFEKCAAFTICYDDTGDVGWKRETAVREYIR